MRNPCRHINGQGTDHVHLCETFCNMCQIFLSVSWLLEFHQHSMVPLEHPVFSSSADIVRDPRTAMYIVDVYVCGKEKNTCVSFCSLFFFW